MHITITRSFTHLIIKCINKNYNKTYKHKDITKIKIKDIYVIVTFADRKKYKFVSFVFPNCNN